MSAVVHALVRRRSPPHERLLRDYFSYLCRYLLEPRRGDAVRPSAVITGNHGIRPTRVNFVRVPDERDIRATRTQPRRVIAGARGAALAAIQESERDLMLFLHRIS